MERVRELTEFTGVPGRFQLVYFVHTADRYESEKYAHRTLDRFRIRSWEEFFEVPLNKAVDTLDEAAEMHPLWWGMPGRLQRKKSLGRLPQVFRHALVACPKCSQKNQVRELAIHVRVKCGRCQKVLGESSIQQLEGRLDRLRQELHRAVESEDFEGAAELRDEIRSLEPA